MAGVVGVALRGFGKALGKFAKKQKTTGGGAIKSVPPSKRGKEFAKHKDDVIKSVDKHSKGVTEEGKIKIRKGTSKVLGKISNILKRKK